MQFSLRNASELPMLSQSRRIRTGVFSAKAHGAPVPFSRTLAASLTSDHFFEVGTGSVNPTSYAKLFLQYACDNNIRVEDLAADFYEYVGGAARNASLWRTISAFITGSSSRLVPADKLAQIPPEIVFEEIKKMHPASHDIFTYALTDAVVGVLAPLGLVYGDVRFVYRISRTPTYPDFAALVDVVAARQLKGVLTALSDVDVTTLKRQMAAKASINPLILASALNQAMHVAWERSRGSYSASDVTVSVLSCLGKAWDASLAGGAELPTRIRNSSGFDELYTNLGLFLAYQDMIEVAGITPGAVSITGVPFPDEELANVVIPLFREAISEVSPFVIRPIGDCVSMVGLTTSRRHDEFPALSILYEDWAAPKEMIAFVPVRLSHKGNERFLDTDVGITERLSMGMVPAVQEFGVPAFAAARKATHDLTPAHSRVPKQGSSMVLGFPSLTEREVAAGRSGEDILEYIKTGAAPLDAEGNPTPPTRAFKWTAFSAYAHLVHIAASRIHSGTMDVAHAASRSEASGVSVLGSYPLFLRWNIPTSFQEAVGEGAVYNGIIVSTEPVEAIAYSSDFSPTTKMTVAAPPIQDYPSAVHIWDFMSAASRVDYVSTYATTLRNKPYSAIITEKEILGFSASRPRLHAMRSPVARSIIAMWNDWFLSDLTSIRAGAAGTKDPSLKAVYEGAELATALDVMNRLITIGSTGLGANVARAVEGQIRDSLVSSGYIDDVSDLTVGVQRTSILIYAGLVTLELLGLMTPGESGSLMTVIRDSRAMSVWVASHSQVYR